MIMSIVSGSNWPTTHAISSRVQGRVVSLQYSVVCRYCPYSVKVVHDWNL